MLSDRRQANTLSMATSGSSFTQESELSCYSFMRRRREEVREKPKSVFRRRVVRKIEPAFSRYATRDYSERAVIHIIEGCYYLHQNGVERCVPSGATLLLFPHQGFRLYARSEGYRGLAVYSSHCGADAYHRQSVILPEDLALTALAQKVVALIEDEKDYERDLIIYGGEYLVALAYSRMRRTLGAGYKSMEFWVDSAKTLIEANLEDSIGLRQLLKNIPYSYEHFIRVFKSSTGFTPKLFQEAKRVELAREYLKDRQYTITQIAYMLGYSSSQHFSTDFRKRVGVSPNQYRKIGPAAGLGVV